GMDRRQAGRIPCRAPLPRTRGDGPVSADYLLGRETSPPHARGWTSSAAIPRAWMRLSPARAGMDPHPWSRPAPALALPRTRGDGPVGASFGRYQIDSPPHARGWTSVLHDVPRAWNLSPARAGMDLLG